MPKFPAGEGLEQEHLEAVLNLGTVLGALAHEQGLVGVRVEFYSRPDWDKVGAQFVADVVPFEMMKLRMLNGSHSFLAYLGYLGGYETIADTMTNPAYRKAAFALMMQEQAPTLSMPEGTDLNAYATLLIERFSNPSLRHRTWQIAME